MNPSEDTTRLDCQSGLRRNGLGWWCQRGQCIWQSVLAVPWSLWGSMRQESLQPGVTELGVPMIHCQMGRMKPPQVHVTPNGMDLVSNKGPGEFVVGLWAKPAK